jgi:hypothetical protein
LKFYPLLAKLEEGDERRWALSKLNTALQQFQVAEGLWVPKTPGEISAILGVKYDRLGLNVGSLPFAPPDATAGSESEMQTVVIGDKRHVDLPLFIEQSNYFSNTKRRAKAGDTSRKVMTDLEKYLNVNA